MDDLIAEPVSNSSKTAALVECPNCEKRRYVSPGRYLCGGCGTWFDVRPNEGGSR